MAVHRLERLVQNHEAHLTVWILPSFVARSVTFSGTNCQRFCQPTPFLHSSGSHLFTTPADQ